MISNRCARKSLLINCNSIISKNYLRFLVDNNEYMDKKIQEYDEIIHFTRLCDRLRLYVLLEQVYPLLIA